MGAGVGFTVFLPMDAHGWIPALSSRCFSPQIPVDGAWGPWAPWSACSRSCGGGVSSSHRFCSRPAPLNGGRFCRGERLRFRSCKAQDCPGRSGEWRRAAGRSAELRAARGPSRVPFAPSPRRVPGGAMRSLQPPRRFGGAAGGGRLGASVRRRGRGGPLQTDVPVPQPGRLPRAAAAGEFPPLRSLPPRGAAPCRRRAAPCRRSRTGRRARRRAAAFASGAAASPPAATASSAPRRSSTNACGAAATAPAAPRCPAPSPRPGERAGRGGTHGCAGRLRPRRSPRCSFQPSSQLPPLSISSPVPRHPPCWLCHPLSVAPPGPSFPPIPSTSFSNPTVPSVAPPPPVPSPGSATSSITLPGPDLPSNILSISPSDPFVPSITTATPPSPPPLLLAPPPSSLPLRPLSTHLSPPFPLLAPHPPSNPHPQLF